MRTLLENSLLNPTALYLVDNGACFCGRHCGTSAQMTGRDISGQAVYRVTAEDVAAAKADGWPIRCERCGAEVTL